MPVLPWTHTLGYIIIAMYEAARLPGFTASVNAGGDHMYMGLIVSPFDQVCMMHAGQQDVCWQAQIQPTCMDKAHDPCARAHCVACRTFYRTWL